MSTLTPPGRDASLERPSHESRPASLPGTFHDFGVIGALLTALAIALTAIGLLSLPLSAARQQHNNEQYRQIAALQARLTRLESDADQLRNEVTIAVLPTHLDETCNDPLGSVWDISYVYHTSTGTTRTIRVVANATLMASHFERGLPRAHDRLFVTFHVTPAEAMVLAYARQYEGTFARSWRNPDDPPERSLMLHELQRELELRGRYKTFENPAAR